MIIDPVVTIIICAAKVTDLCSIIIDLQRKDQLLIPLFSYLIILRVP